MQFDGWGWYFSSLLNELQGDDGSVCWVVRLKGFSTVAGPTYAMATRIQPP